MLRTAGQHVASSACKLRGYNGGCIFHLCASYCGYGGSVRFSSVQFGSVRFAYVRVFPIHWKRDWFSSTSTTLHHYPLRYSTATAPTRRHATCQALWTWANLLCRVVCSLEIRYASRSEVFFSKNCKVICTRYECLVPKSYLSV